jgi:two-component system cell cycle response regulator
MAENDENDQLEKTSVVQSDTFKGRLQAANEAPPVLVILVGPQGYVGKQFAITKTDLVIGRSVECDIFIDDKSISRSHAKLVLQSTDVAIIDLGSTNKTVVNVQTLPPLAPCVLKNNDQVKTGKYCF